MDSNKIMIINDPFLFFPLGPKGIINEIFSKRGSPHKKVEVPSLDLRDSHCAHVDFVYSEGDSVRQVRCSNPSSLSYGHQGWLCDSHAQQLEEVWAHHHAPKVPRRDLDLEQVEGIIRSDRIAILRGR